MAISVKPGQGIPPGGIPVTQPTKPFWQAWAQFGTQLGSVATQLATITGQLEQLHTYLTANPRGNNPLVRPMAISDVGDATTATGYMVLTMEPPVPAGYVRDLRRYAVVGLPNPFTAQSSVNVLAMKTGQRYPMPYHLSTLVGNLTFGDVISAPVSLGTGLSTINMTRMARLKGGESLVFVLQNVASGQTIQITGEAEDYLESTPPFQLAE